MTKLNTVETKTEFAARVGLTKGRISQLVADGLPVQPDGTIAIAEGLAWMEANLDPARRNKGGTPPAPVATGTLSLAEARRMYMVVQVQRARLAYDKERGQVIDAKEAAAAVFSRAKAERDAHMAWVSRTVPLLAAETGSCASIWSTCPTPRSGPCAMANETALSVVDRAWRRGIRPEPPIPVSEWADRNRVLPPTSAEPGRWRTNRTPAHATPATACSANPSPAGNW